MKCRLMVSTLLALFVAGSGTALAAANDVSGDMVTFHRDVLPILQENCQICHRPNGANLGGMVAPMAFTSYADTRPWAKSIARQAEARTMPPWHASPEHAGVFANERTLTAGEIDTLVGWAKTGAQEGDIADAPAPKEFPAGEGWVIGEPDLVVSMGERYFIEDDVEDQYITFTSEITAEMMPEPRWLKGVEFRPGSSVVHHIIARPLGGIAPGNDPTLYNDGYGTLLVPGSKVSWQMHYHKEPGPGTGVYDLSTAALKFYPVGTKPDYVVQNESLGKLDFVIPAGDPNYTAKTSTTFERASYLLGYTPHAHLRGKSVKYVAYYPDGTEEVLLHVPDYDFNWQTHYEYPGAGKLVPAGTRIELEMSWDNSAENPYNPDPTAEVVFGRPTTAEMMFGFVSYADAEPGYTPLQRGFLGSDEGREERIRALIKQRFGVEPEELTPEQRQELMKQFGGRQRGASGGG